MYNDFAMFVNRLELQEKKNNGCSPPMKAARALGEQHIRRAVYQGAWSLLGQDAACLSLVCLDMLVWTCQLWILGTAGSNSTA